MPQSLDSGETGNWGTPANRVAPILTVQTRSAHAPTVARAQAASASDAAPARALLPGAKLLLMVLTALPPAVVGLSAATPMVKTTGLITALWFALLPVALFRRWAALTLPVVASALLLYTVLALPFNSAPFMVNFWMSGAMLLLALPRR